MSEARRQGTTNAVTNWARGLPEAFLLCRDLGHNWRPLAARYEPTDRVYLRTLRCSRCETERHQTLSASGHVVSGSYAYPAEYQQPKGSGSLDSGGRDMLRLESLVRVMGADEVAVQRTSRRRGVA